MTQKERASKIVSILKELKELVRDDDDFSLIAVALWPDAHSDLRSNGAQVVVGSQQGICTIYNDLAYEDTGSEGLNTCRDIVNARHKNVLNSTKNIQK